MKTILLSLILLCSLGSYAQMAPNVYLGTQHNITNLGNHTGVGAAGEIAINEKFSFIFRSSYTGSSEEVGLGQLGIIKEKYNVLTALTSVKYYPKEVGKGFSAGFGIGYLNEKVKLKDIPDNVNVTGRLSSDFSAFLTGLDLGYQYNINDDYAISLDSGLYVDFADGSYSPIFLSVRKTFQK